MVSRVDAGWLPLRVRALGFGVHGLELGFRGARFRIWGFVVQGFRCKGSGFAAGFAFIFLDAGGQCYKHQEYFVT